MAFKATPFADLPITTDQKWDPTGKGLTEIMNEVLGDDDWERYKKAHLVWNDDAADTKAGYKLPIARMVDGQLTVIVAQLGAAVAAINGARGGVDLPDEVRREAYDHAVKYYKKADVDDADIPEFMATKKVARHSVPNVTLVSDSGTIDPGDEATPKWQHVANEGQFLGYRHGEDPFAFTRETFEQIVRNFRRNPQYNAGPDGIGMADVLPWDFEHASEQYASDGTIPSEGAPAQGWVRDVQVKNGPDGTAQLWALSIFLPTARKYIQEGQYKWSSVAVILNAVDSITGERIGAMMTSIALTNHPFIQDLQPLAASIKSANTLRIRWYEAAGTALEALGSLKDLFGLKELAPLSEVMIEVGKLQQWIETGTTPLGIDMGEIFSALRQILNLGTLTSETEVLDALNKITQRAIEEQAVGDGSAISQPSPTSETNSATMAGANGGMEMLTTLANKFQVKETETEVMGAVEDAIELRREVSKELACSTKSSEIIEKTAELRATGERHNALLTALGSDADNAVARVGELQLAAKELAELKPQHETLEKRIDEIDRNQAEADVDLVIAANGFDASIKDALLLQRQQDPKVFADKFPVDANKVNLTQTVVNNQTTVAPTNTGAAANPNAINLAMYPGANKTARAIAYLASQNADFRNTPWDDQCKVAHNFLKREDVIDK